MSVDIWNLSQATGAYSALNTARTLLARTGLDEAKQIREVMLPLASAQSLLAKMASEETRQRQALMDVLNVQATIDGLMEEHRRQNKIATSCFQQYAQPLRELELLMRKHCRHVTVSPARSVLEPLFRHVRNVSQIVDLSSPKWPQFEAARSFKSVMDEAMRVSAPFRTVLDQIRAHELTAAPALVQFPAVEIAKRFTAWPVGDESEAEVGWAVIDERLDRVYAAIQQLPTQDATPHQIQSTGLRRAEWVMLFLGFFGLLLQLLAYVDTLEQGRFARAQAATHQAAENEARAAELAFRQRLLSTIEALARHAPPPKNSVFVVGGRPATIRSGLKAGKPLSTAYPNQLVTVVDHRGRWVRIQYRDNLAQGDIEGWVLKHYLVPQTAIPVEHEGNLNP